MCDMYLCYYEKENLFVDECGEVVYDIFTIITPRDLYMFRYDYDKYDKFQFVGNHDITVHIIVIPDGDICSPWEATMLDLEDILQVKQARYEWFEQQERTHMANVGG